PAPGQGCAEPRPPPQTRRLPAGRSELAEVVARSSLGENETRVAGMLFDLFPEPADGHVHGADIPMVPVAPYVFQKGFPAENLPGMLGQVLEQLELPGGQFDLLLALEHLVPLQVDGQVPAVDVVGGV